MRLNSLVLACTAASPLWLAVLWCLAVPLAASDQQHEQRLWTWKDNRGNVRSRTDLKDILDLHRSWLNSNGVSGARADLSDANLRDAELGGANLEHANLERADLSRAKLGGANLSEAVLASARLDNANLEHAVLRGAHLNGAYLTEAHLDDANLTYAELIGTNLTGAVLERADLNRAYLDYANLSAVDLRGAYFEPASFVELLEPARARGLEDMTYHSTPRPLTQLRKEFQDAGFRGPERAITCALNRAEARDSPTERWFRWIAFDLTSRYGLSPGRPLRIVLWLWLFFSGVYAYFMHRPGPLGIYFVGTRRWRIQVRPRATRATKRRRLRFPWLWQECRVLRAAMFFSLMSASNIGFRDINFGQWLRKLTRYEYDLRAVGWARTLSGLQSLLSVYLIALCVLTYFGRPFG